MRYFSSVKKLILLCLLSGAMVFARAQSLEFGIMGGVSNYQGDLSDQKINFNLTRPAGGALVRFNVNKFLSLKGNVFYGTIEGRDSLSDKPTSQYRNLSFKSSLLEFSGQVEVNLLGFGFDTRRQTHYFSPYVFAGLSVFNFNPKAYYNNVWYELQPLGTEGQGLTAFQTRKRYSLTQFALPVGLGFKVRLSPNWTLGGETGVRMTTTDYMDDVSTTYVDEYYLKTSYGINQPSAALADRTQERYPNMPKNENKAPRGNPNKLDRYFFTGLTLSYKFPIKGPDCRSF